MLILHACGQQRPHGGLLREAPDAINNPALMGVTSKPYQQVASRAVLPSEKKPWSGDYWPTFKGGIAYRWQTMRHGTNWRHFIYQVLSPEQLNSLSQHDLDLLSPAEKYDLFTANHHFPITREELAQAPALIDTTLDDVPHWYGLCHGWVIAATAEPQPGALAQITASNGRVLRFFSSDIKALLSKYYADTQVNSNFIGGRCNNKYIRRDAGGRIITSECRDLNPATFHLVVENYIAHRRQSINIDIDPAVEVWTQPAYGYEFAYANLRPLGAEPGYRVPAPGTAALIDVRFKLLYADEALSTRGPIESIISRQVYDYTLELDQNDFIIGGEWRSEKHPDFMWQLRSSNHARLQGGLDYGIIKELLNLSLRTSG